MEYVENEEDRMLCAEGFIIVHEPITDFPTR
jgi:hypothetical protein